MPRRAMVVVVKKKNVWVSIFIDTHNLVRYKGTSTTQTRNCTMTYVAICTRPNETPAQYEERRRTRDLEQINERRAAAGMPAQTRAEYDAVAAWVRAGIIAGNKPGATCWVRRR